MQNRFVLILALLAILIVPLHGDESTSPIPIHIKTRGSFKTPGSIVLMITSTTDDSLTLQIHAASADGKNQKDFSYDIAPHAKQSIGSQQGWAGAPGDVFTIQCDGYANTNYTLHPPKKSTVANDGTGDFGQPAP